MSKVGLLKARKQGRVSATVMMQISQRIWPLLSLAVFSASFATEQTVDRWMYIEDVPIGRGPGVIGVFFLMLCFSRQECVECHRTSNNPQLWTLKIPHPSK